MLTGPKRWIKLVPNVLLVAVAVLVVSGAVYEQIGRSRDRKRFPQIGRSVDIGGRTGCNPGSRSSLKHAGTTAPVMAGAIRPLWLLGPVRQSRRTFTYFCTRRRFRGRMYSSGRLLAASTSGYTPSSIRRRRLA